MAFVTLEMGWKLEWVNFRKDVWDCYYEQGKKIGQKADRRVQIMIPETICGTHVGSWAPFLESLDNVSAGKAVLRLQCLHSRSKFQ